MFLLILLLLLILMYKILMTTLGRRSSLQTRPGRMSRQHHRIMRRERISGSEDL